MGGKDTVGVQRQAMHTTCWNSRLFQTLHSHATHTQGQPTSCHPAWTADQISCCFYDHSCCVLFRADKAVGPGGLCDSSVREKRTKEVQKQEECQNSFICYPFLFFLSSFLCLRMHAIRRVAKVSCRGSMGLVLSQAKEERRQRAGTGEDLLLISLS